MGLNWKGWELFSKNKTVEKKEEKKNTYTMTNEDRLREIRLKSEAMKQDMEFEAERRRHMNSFLTRDSTSTSSQMQAQMQAQLRSSGITVGNGYSQTVGMATSIPGNVSLGQSSLSSYNTGGFNNSMWQYTSPDPNTLSDRDKAIKIVGLMSREGFNNIEAGVLGMVLTMFQNAQPMSQQETKKQPKKKLDL